MNNKIARSVFATVAIGCAASFALPQPSSASNCSLEEFDHNGSTMEIHFCDGGINIAYDIPRGGLGKYDIEQGTLLFEGSSTYNGLISGEARVFKRGCSPATYPVSGRLNGDLLVLNGRAPVRNSSCGVKRFRKDHLKFKRIGGQ